MFFFIIIQSPPSSTLFPYTTLFRSDPAHRGRPRRRPRRHCPAAIRRSLLRLAPLARRADRKSTRLNSSHVEISYAVFCLKKKISKYQDTDTALVIGRSGAEGGGVTA